MSIGISLSQYLSESIFDQDEISNAIDSEASLNILAQKIKQHPKNKKNGIRCRIKTSAKDKAINVEIGGRANDTMFDVTLSDDSGIFDAIDDALKQYKYDTITFKNYEDEYENTIYLTLEFNKSSQTDFLNHKYISNYGNPITIAGKANYKLVWDGRTDAGEIILKIKNRGYDLNNFKLLDNGFKRCLYKLELDLREAGMDIVDPGLSAFIHKMNPNITNLVYEEIRREAADVLKKYYKKYPEIDNKTHGIKIEDASIITGLAPDIITPNKTINIYYSKDTVTPGFCFNRGNIAKQEYYY